MPISHLGINTADIATSKKFYDAALAPLRYKVALQFNDGKVLGYGDEKGPSFWVHEVTDLAKKSGNVHVAFDAKSEEEVKAFYDAAMYVPLYRLAEASRSLTLFSILPLVPLAGRTMALLVPVLSTQPTTMAPLFTTLKETISRRFISHRSLERLKMELVVV